MNVLLINPWVQDFSAYNLWTKPLGLFIIARILRDRGVSVQIIDCLGRLPQAGLRHGRTGDGRGKFREEIIRAPEPLSGIRRRYRRFGIPGAEFLSRLRSVPRPDAVLVTSGMTYWYPGVAATIRAVRSIHPRVQVILGGIYATLCPDHARAHSGADDVIEGEGLQEIFMVLGLEGTPPRFPDWPVPLDPLERGESVSLLTSRGCPFRCTYCASHLLGPRRERKGPDRVVDEIAGWYGRGVRHFAFYDDALLIDPEGHIARILEGVMERGFECRFHAPNGLHARGLTQGNLARLMKRAGFATIRLGLESSRAGTQGDTGGKVTGGEFVEAVRALREAGYRSEEIGAYILAGLPRQEAEEVREGIEFVRRAGARPIIAEYSPIPGTSLWEAACRASPFPLKEEPLYQNNTILPCRWERFTIADLQGMKDLCRGNPCGTRARPV